MALKAKIIDIHTGEELILSSDNRVLIIKQGVNKGDAFEVNEIVHPSETYPEGLFKSRRIGLGWQQLLPSVFDLRMEVVEIDTDAPAE